METLPWYKNNPSEWIGGDISWESWAVQGFFKTICDFYWIRGGNLTQEMMLRKFPAQECAEYLRTLVQAQIVKVDAQGKLQINFLDEQMESSERRMKANKSNASKKKRKPNGKPNGSSNGSTNKNPMGNPMGEPVVKPMGDRIREEKRREDIPPKVPLQGDALEGFEEFYSEYPVKRSKQRAQSAWKKLGKNDRRKARDTLQQFITSQTSEGISICYPATYLNGRRWEDDFSTSMKVDGKTDPEAEAKEAAREAEVAQRFKNATFPQ